MPAGDQLKALIRSHFDEDEERFHTLALQVAAHEAWPGAKGSESKYLLFLVNPTSD